MRPRPKDRGNVTTATVARSGRSIWPLQCGHGSFSGELLGGVGEKLALPERANLLQCGHGPNTVENGSCGHILDTESPGFNAATARSPWRTKRRFAS